MRLSSRHSAGSDARVERVPSDARREGAAMHFHETVAEIGRLRLNYAEGPAHGPPLVVLHGGAGRWQYSERFLELLADRWHVFAPDFRGHGKSGRVPGAYRLDDYVADTEAFLRQVVRAPAVVFGHSLGGEVALKTTATSPAH